MKKKSTKPQEEEEEERKPKRRKTTKNEKQSTETKEVKKKSTTRKSATRGKKQKEVEPKVKMKEESPVPIPSQDTTSQVHEVPSQSESEVSGIEVPEHAKSFSYMHWLARGPPPHKGETKIPKGKPYCLFGKHFLITGILDSLEREDAWDLIKQYGGGVHKSIVKCLTHVIVGTDPGPSKLEKLKQMPKVKLMKESDLLHMIATLPEQHPTNEELQKINRRRPQRFAAATIEEEIKPAKAPKTKGHHEPPKAPPEETKYELWAEKYRPKTSDELVGNPGLISELREWLKIWHLGQIEDVTKKAVLISGPPGIGKTSAAWVVARETGFEPIEMNASDSRTRAFLEEHIEDATHNKTILDYFGAQRKKEKIKMEEEVSHKMPCVIMDEVDGIYERGGVTELIALIKKSQIPIICICNDRYSPKLRALATHCLDMRFRRPSVAQSLPRITRIAQLEGFEGDTLTLEKILESVHGDLRQALNTLQVWSAQGLNYSPELKARLKNRIGKDASLTPIDAIMQLFLNHGRHVPIQEKVDLYFVDPNLEPLLVQENYLNVKPFLVSNVTEKFGSKKASLEYMNAVSRAADWISSGDLFERSMRSGRNFELMKEHAVLSTAAPSHELKGFIEGAPNWPSWFGKTSHMKANYKVLHYLHTHMRTFTTADSTAFCLDYLPTIVPKLVSPLQDPGGKAGVREVLQFMDEYDMDQEDWNSILDIGQIWTNEFVELPASVKSQFTKQLQHHTHMKHTARSSDEVKLEKKVKKKKLIVEEEEEEESILDHELQGDDS